jgi:hypothetical protein
MSCEACTDSSVTALGVCPACGNSSQLDSGEQVNPAPSIAWTASMRSGAATAINGTGIAALIPSSYVTRAVILLWASIGVTTFHYFSEIGGSWRGLLTIFFVLGFKIYCTVSVQKRFAIGRDLISFGFLTTAIYMLAVRVDTGRLAINLEFLSLVLMAVALGLLYFGSGRKELNSNTEESPLETATARQDPWDERIALGKLFMIAYLAALLLATAVAASTHSILMTLTGLTGIALVVFVSAQVLLNRPWARSAWVILLAGLIGVTFTSPLTLSWKLPVLGQLLMWTSALIAVYLLATPSKPAVHAETPGGLVVSDKILKALALITATAYGLLLLSAG